MYELWLLFNGHGHWSHYWMELLSVSFICGVVGISFITYRDTAGTEDRIRTLLLDLHDVSKELLLSKPITVLLAVLVVLALMGWLFLLLALLPRRLLEKIKLVNKRSELKNWNST